MSKKQVDSTEAARGSLKEIIKGLVASEQQNFLREIVEYRGYKFEIREPDEKGRQKIMTKSIYAIAKKRREEGSALTPEELDQLDIEQEVLYRTWAMIECTYDPETGEKVFDESQIDELLKLPASTFDPLKAAAIRLCNPNRAELAKKSSTTSDAGTASK